MPRAQIDERAFDLDRILAIEPDFLGEDDHEHDDAIKSVALRIAQTLDPDLFNQWIGTHRSMIWSGDMLQRSVL